MAERVLLLLLLLASVLAFSPQAVAQADARRLQEIDAWVAAEVRASGIPGAALAIVQPGGAPHVRAFGHDGRGRPIDGDTPFPIGSLSKSFTALLVRQAIEAGALDADAPVQRYLPWFRLVDEQAAARITLRHLLNQTSGLSRADGMAPLLGHVAWMVLLFDAAVLAAVAVCAALAFWGARRGRHLVLPLAMLLAATAIVVAPALLGLGARGLAKFAPDLALAGVVCAVLLALPAVLRLSAALRRALQAKP
jgi:CubicO group peptidase (beta-lactamase class C family)